MAFEKTMIRDNSPALALIGLPSTQAQQLFWEKSTLKNYAKNELLFESGKLNSTEYLLLEGVLHRFNENEKFENVTTGFYLGPTAVTPRFARTTQERSLFSLQALTSVTVAEIPVAELDKLRYAHREFQLFGLKVVEDEISQNLKIDIAHRSGNAQERLDLFRKMYPGLENLVPHHVIASYLGITNVSLSRLRAQSPR